MSLHTAKVGTLVIPAGVASAFSNILESKLLSFATALVFHTPASFTGDISLHGGFLPGRDVVGDLTPVALDLGLGSTAIELTANQIQRINTKGIRTLAVQTSGTEAAERSIDVFAVLNSPDGEL